ncbi:MAG: peptidoglycan-binding domain-containing protein [Candidatus Jorgensenbacteria bacterium]|nr:peptidoglycan-binding domain-containing protein [Candidatus Jorgensenbacteria bacterium]
MRNALNLILVSAFILVLGLFSIAQADGLFSTDLYFGMQGSTEVTKLQEFLTSEGVYNGPITGNFFSLTLKGVRDYQTREGISPAAGYFGPLTRVKANTGLSTQIEASNAQAISETGITPTPLTTPKTTTDVTNTMQSQLDALLQQIALLQQQIQVQQQSQQSIQSLENKVVEQTQTIQTQQQTLTQIQQNTQQQRETLTQIQTNTAPTSTPIIPSVRPPKVVIDFTSTTKAMVDYFYEPLEIACNPETLTGNARPRLALPQVDYMVKCDFTYDPNENNPKTKKYLFLSIDGYGSIPVSWLKDNLIIPRTYEDLREAENKYTCGIVIPKVEAKTLIMGSEASVKFYEDCKVKYGL